MLRTQGRLQMRSDTTKQRENKLPLLRTFCVQTLLKPFVFNGKRSPAKGVVSVMAARVQIPASPLKPLKHKASAVFSFHPVVPGQTPKHLVVAYTVAYTKRGAPRVGEPLDLILSGCCTSSGTTFWQRCCLRFLPPLEASSALSRSWTSSPPTCRSCRCCTHPYRC